MVAYGGRLIDAIGPAERVLNRQDQQVRARGEKRLEQRSSNR
jgi:hypothetical protein